MNEILKLDFLTELNYSRVLLDLVLLFGISKLIEFVYKSYAYSNDNKLLFTKHMFNFLIAIFLIVTVIKSSIALSLGLVGALSIIRFRTAIKEPGQLINLLMLTAISISMAAEKELLGLLIAMIYCGNTYFNRRKDQENLSISRLLRISITDNDLDLQSILNEECFLRMYKDVNDVIHLEFQTDANSVNLVKILKSFEEKNQVVSYEIL